MITGVFKNGIRQYTDFVVTSADNGIISLQGYNFNLLEGVILTADVYAAGLSTFTFPRQPTLSGINIEHDVIDKNVLTVNVSSFSTLVSILSSEVVLYMSVIPYNVAGYSKSSRSNNTTFLQDTPTRIIYDNTGGNNYLVDGDFNLFVTGDGDYITI